MKIKEFKELGYELIEHIEADHVSALVELPDTDNEEDMSEDVYCQSELVDYEFHGNYHITYSVCDRGLAIVEDLSLDEAIEYINNMESSKQKEFLQTGED